MNSNKYKILVVDDDSSSRSLVCSLLEANNYRALSAETCDMAIMMFASHTPDLVIIETALPDRDGKNFIVSVRQDSSVPVIVLSSISGENDKVEALDLGANDYITKPFSSAELLARIRCALRNSRYGSSRDNLHGKKFRLDSLAINYDSRQIFIDKKEIKLTQTEYNIVALLAAHCGKMLTYSTIIKAIWGYNDSGSIKKLQVNVANIRKKLGTKPDGENYITNELGVGYIMRDKQLKEE